TCLVIQLRSQVTAAFTVALTQAVLGIDLSRSAVPSYVFLRSGSTEPDPRLPALTQKQGDIHEKLPDILACRVDHSAGFERYSQGSERRQRWLLKFHTQG